MTARIRSIVVALQLSASASWSIAGTAHAEAAEPEQSPTPTVGIGSSSDKGTTSESIAAPGSSTTAALDTWGTDNTPALASDSQPEGDAPLPVPSESGGCAANDSTLESDGNTPVRYHLERIEVRGNDRTRPAVILRYLPFRIGKDLDVTDVEFTLARYRLLGTGFFREVEFSLRKGSKRGNVVLVVDVVERNTVVINGIWMGLSKNADRNGNERLLGTFGGFELAETNLAGTGITLGGAVGLADNQYALRVRALHPGFLGSPWMVNLTLLHNSAEDYFGTGNVKWGPNDDAQSDYAVVHYKRFGGTVGIGRDLSVSTQLWFHYRLETISANIPAFARYDRGGRVENIEFDILPGRSVFSTVRASFQIDTRDHPFLPTRGWFVSTWGELGLLPLGSNYDFQRFDISASYYWHRRDSAQVWRLQLFAGAMTGNVPFFEQYYVGDFSELLPPRMLSLNVDARPSHNVFGTSIGEVRYGQYAAQIVGEYRLPIFRGHRSVYGVDFFVRAGLFSVAHRRDLVDPAPKYHGIRSIPFDLTANAGVRMDTSIGGIALSFSNVLGLLPGGGE